MLLSGLAVPRATEPKTRGRAVPCGRTALRVASSLVTPVPFAMLSGSVIGCCCDTGAQCQRFELFVVEHHVGRSAVAQSGQSGLSIGYGPKSLQVRRVPLVGFEPAPPR